MSGPDPRVADVLIRDLVESFPEPRPAADVVATVVAEGSRQRRRRRRGGALGGLVVAALMSLATLALVHASTAPSTPTASPPAGAATPRPPAGTVWLRHDRAALAVPATWREDVACGGLGVRVTARDRRWDGLDPTRCFAGASGGAGWVRFGSFDTAVGAALARTVPSAATSADGKPADSLTIAPVCDDDACTGVVVLAQSGEFALVRGATRAAVERVTGSLVFLAPPGSTDPGGS